MTVQAQLRNSSALATARPIGTPEDVRAALDDAMKKAHDDLAQMIVDERQLTDERIAAAAKGLGVSEIEAKLAKAQTDIAAGLEKLNELIVANARAGVAGRTGETRDVAAAARHFFASAGKLKADEEVTPAQVQEYEAYEKAWRQYLRRNTARGEILNLLEVGGDADGGFLAPTTIDTAVKSRIFETSPVRQVARVISISTDDYEFPLDVEEAVTGGWVQEKAARPETDTPKVGIQKIPTHENYANPAITQKLLDDAGMDVVAWLIEKLRRKFTRDENYAYVNGSGATGPRGFLSYAAASVTTADSARDWGILQHIITGAADDFPEETSGADNLDALIDVVAELKPEYRIAARWAMNRRSEAKIRKKKDAEGNYLVQFGVLREGVFGFSLLGHPIINFEDMPAFGSGLFPIAFGDFGQGYTIIDRMGMRVLRDPYTNKPKVHFYTTVRGGGDVTDFDAIKLLKCAAP